jgi:ferredoxin
MSIPDWLPLHPSTRAFIHEAQLTPGYRVSDFLHGYVYARWPYLYIGIATGEHPLSPIYRRLAGWLSRLLPRWMRTRSPGEGTTFADTYHGKVVTLESASRLVTVDREISLHNLEQVIPYALARDIVLKNPDHLVVLDCPCRASRANPCLPLDVCLIVGEPFASFVAEHHRRRARWITRDEAVEILRAEHARGHVHHAFFKDAMLGRFYAICNCCACCCGAMQAMRQGVPMLASSGYVCQVNEELCIGCGTCAAHCQFQAIRVIQGRSVVDTDACMGCGVCVDQCQQGALTLVRDARKSLPLELEALAPSLSTPDSSIHPLGVQHVA